MRLRNHFIDNFVFPALACAAGFNNNLHAQVFVKTLVHEFPCSIAILNGT